MSQVSHVQVAGVQGQAPGEQVRSLLGRRRFITSDRVMVGLARLGASGLILMLVLLLAVLVYAAWLSIRTFGGSFLVTSQWRPNVISVPARDSAGHVIIKDGQTAMTKQQPALGSLPSVYCTGGSSAQAAV